MNKLKKVKLKDILGIFKFIIVLIPALILKIYNKIFNREVWLVCEKDDMARDNGFVFFKYVKENHPNVKCYYAIDKKCNDYKKVCCYDTVVAWSSLKHYMLYMSCTNNISSHKEGNPNHTLFTILHLYLKLYNNRVFLQHGVLYTDMKMFYKKNTYFKLFICGAEPEYNFVKKKYGYTKNEVKYTGLARFDYLYNTDINKNEILYIPTWRRQFDTLDKFKNSLYYKRINELLNNDDLIFILEKYNINFNIYLHTGVQKYKNLYKTKSKKIKICYIENTDIQYLLKKCALMITDFSSVSTDFAYMNKPIIYYQYDYDDYYIHEGSNNSYFHYKIDGFGPVVNNLQELLQNLENYINKKFKNEEIYEKRINKFFKFRDQKNCERIFYEITGGK